MTCKDYPTKIVGGIGAKIVVLMGEEEIGGSFETFSWGDILSSSCSYFFSSWANYTCPLVDGPSTVVLLFFLLPFTKNMIFGLEGLLELGSSLLFFILIFDFLPTISCDSSSDPMRKYLNQIPISSNHTFVLARVGSHLSLIEVTYFCDHWMVGRGDPTTLPTF